MNFTTLQQFKLQLARTSSTLRTLDLDKRCTAPTQLGSASNTFPTLIQNEMDRKFLTCCNFKMNTMNTNFKLLGSKTRLSYDWLSLAPIPKPTQWIITKRYRSMKVANGGLKILKCPNSLITKIPNSSYLRHVDRARYRERRSSIFQALIKLT